MSKKKWRKRAEFDVSGPLVEYGESDGPPCRWPTGMTRQGAASVQGSEQQCDDHKYLGRRYLETEGLYNNVEGEAIGDMT